MALAYRADIPLEDMEFVQFHPTTLKDTGILITEGARGKVAIFLNTLGERFMKRQYAPEQMELATRSTVSLAIGQEIPGRAGVDGCVLLDLRHLGRTKILERLPQIRELAMEFAGLDPIETPIPIRPGAHYQMGGVKTNAWGDRPSGALCRRECACVSVHGANRLGGNSSWKRLSSVAGRARERRTSSATATSPIPATHLQRETQRVKTLLTNPGPERAWQIRDDLGKP